MNRRKFLSMGVGVVAASLLPAVDLLAVSTLSALPDVFAIAGPAKSGKSLLAAELAIARAGGRSTFLDRFSVKQGRTLLLDDQHSSSVLVNRFTRIVAPFDFEKLNLWDERLSRNTNLRKFVDGLAIFGFKHVIADSLSALDRCAYTFREDGADITKPFSFDRDFRRHIGEGVFTDLLRERGITCAFTCNQNAEPVSDDPNDCVHRDNDELHETRDAIVIRRPSFVDYEHRIIHTTKVRTLSGRGAFAKMFSPAGEPHQINSDTLRFEKIS